VVQFEQDPSHSFGMTDQIKLSFRAERGIFLDANKKRSNNHDGVARL
jgi:hypothetical protein